MRSHRPICTLALLAGTVLPAAAQPAAPAVPPAPPAPANLAVAIMPAQYFSADAASAQAVTDALRQDFAAKGWNVLPVDAVKAAWDGMSLQNGVHYPDQTAMDLGAKVNADLVVYPRLLALGLPLPSNLTDGGVLEPAAVVHLRVLNVKRKKAIYFNQIAHEFKAGEAVQVAQFNLPAPTAQLATAEVLVGFFQRVAGSREVLPPDPPAPKKKPAKKPAKKSTRPMRMR